MRLLLSGDGIRQRQSTPANKVFPRIARDGHQARDGTAAVSDLDGFPGSHFFEVPAGVLPQLPHPYRLHVLHSSTYVRNRRPPILRTEGFGVRKCVGRVNSTSLAGHGPYSISPYLVAQ